MGKADLHIHTDASDGMFSAARLLDHLESSDLNVVAVTDHDDLAGSFGFRDLAARGRYHFDVITGVEVTTIEGHLLALNIETPIVSLRPLPETIDAVKRLGGLAVAAHPFSWFARGISERDIRRNSAELDAIETMNTTPAGRGGRKRARRLAAELGLARAGGSDAHFLDAVGTGYTEFRGSTSADLLAAISSRQTRGIAGPHPSVSALGVGAVLRQAYRGVTATPRAVGWGPTARSFVQRIVTVR
jgi:predicted metal-dependent phosphoesterase TrpH